jgi:hypothetical protein
MKIIGYVFVIFGSIWTIAGFASYASDIQLGIAVSGLNMVGIGLIMIKISTNNSSGMNSQ